MQPILRKPKREIDLQQVSADDLRTLKKQDAFMYYSIPGVRNAEMQMKDIDLSNLRNCLSCPARMQTVQATSISKVERSTRISYECHPDLLLEELLNEDGSNSIGSDDGANDPLDDLMKMYGL